MSDARIKLIEIVSRLIRLSRTPAAGGPFRTISRFVIWQVMTRLWGGALGFDFVSGARLFAARGNTSATAQYYYGLYEWDIAGFMLHAIRPGDRVVDIGANVGVYTVLAAGPCGANVIACEPGPEELAALKTNVAFNRLDGQVSVRHLAVGAEPGVLHMKLGHGAMNRVVDDANNSVAIEVTTLDRLWEEGGIDVLKIDTVGYELPILRGGLRTLAESRLKVLILGNARRAKDFGFEPADVIRAATDAGFTPASYDPQTRTLTPVSVVDQNRRTIFVRNAGEMTARVAAARPFKIRGKIF